LVTEPGREVITQRQDEIYPVKWETKIMRRFAMRTKIFLSVSFLMIAIVTVMLSSVSWAQREVVVGNISAMTGPTSGTHTMCQSGAKDYLYYLNDKGGISVK
jgi:hypothetical protein